MLEQARPQEVRFEIGQASAGVWRAFLVLLALNVFVVSAAATFALLCYYR